MSASASMASVHQASPAALVGAAGIGEPIAEHPFAARQRRLDALRHMRRARSKHQQQLGGRRHAASRRASTSARMSSASGVPPGSRVAHTTRPCSVSALATPAAARLARTFDPFKVMKRPRVMVIPWAVEQQWVLLPVDHGATGRGSVAPPGCARGPSRRNSGRHCHRQWRRKIWRRSFPDAGSQ